ncbi:hypothetical protein B0H14DRAFT_3513464 [Mycena olivaceomarginata]|nr:hypothetical protein B0H14DRAFT_3513464 [Mycena olivaceomarginata]
MIRNKKLPTETATAPAAPGTRGTKRKSAGGPKDTPKGKRTFDFTKESRELSKRLECSTHKDQSCFVSTADGHHVRIEPMNVTLWAKEITMGNATLTRPPENIMFQDCFLPGRKRARTTRSESSSTPCTPTIHVTVNTGNPSPPRRSPLATITTSSANTANIGSPAPLTCSLSHVLSGQENTGSDEIRYPVVAEILQLIDDSGMFQLSFPAVIFGDNLREIDITHVDQVPLMDTEFYAKEFNMPLQLAELFVEESIAAMGN